MGPVVDLDRVGGDRAGAARQGAFALLRFYGLIGLTLAGLALAGVEPVRLACLAAGAVIGFAGAVSVGDAMARAKNTDAGLPGAH